MQRITSHGLANIDDPNVLTQLRAKFPARQDVLPASVPLHSPIDSFINLRESLLSLDANRGSSPGCGGMRPEFLVALGDRMDEREMEKALIPVPHSTAMRFISSLRESRNQVCLLPGDRFSFFLQQFL